MMQEFVQKIHDMINSDLRGMHTAMPGKIVSFDTATMLATVLPSMMYKKPDGTTMQYPQISGVPVLFPQGSGQRVTIAFPVKPGDNCLIVVSEQSIDYWMYGQETDTDLAFDMSNAICIPGLFATPNAVMKDACEQNAILLDTNGTRVTVKDGTVQIDAGEVIINGNMKVNGKIDASNDVTGSGVSLAKHTHTGDSGGSTSAPK